MSRQISISSFFKRIPASPQPEPVSTHSSEASGDAERCAAIRTCVCIQDSFAVYIVWIRVEVHRQGFL